MRALLENAALHVRRIRGRAAQALDGRFLVAENADRNANGNSAPSNASPASSDVISVAIEKRNYSVKNFLGCSLNVSFGPFVKSIADQLSGLSGRYRVIAVDMRGHGDSSKPSGGYRMAQLAQDTHEFLAALGLNGVALGGHSLGSSVMWSYWDQYGSERLSHMIVIDQAPTVVAWPGWSDDEKAVAGTVFTPQSLYDTAAALAGPDGVKANDLDRSNVKRNHSGRQEVANGPVGRE